MCFSDRSLWKQNQIQAKNNAEKARNRFLKKAEISFFFLTKTHGDSATMATTNRTCSFYTQRGNRPKYTMKPYDK